MALQSQEASRPDLHQAEHRPIGTLVGFSSKLQNTTSQLDLDPEFPSAKRPPSQHPSPAMARLSSPGSPASSSQDFNRASAELGLLLSRLTQNVVHADPEREQRLRTDEYERAKLERVCQLPM